MVGWGKRHPSTLKSKDISRQSAMSMRRLRGSDPMVLCLAEREFRCVEASVRVPRGPMRRPLSRSGWPQVGRIRRWEMPKGTGSDDERRGGGRS